MADPNRREDDPQDEPVKKGKKWLIPLLVAVIAASAGAAAVTQNDALRQTVGLSVAPPDTTATEAPVEYGVFMDMDGIVVNPRDSDGRRYFMVRVGVEAEDQKALDRLDELGPAATDAVIGLMAAMTVEELADITRRDSLKDALRDRFNGILGDDGPVSRIYFTQYVLQ